MITDTFPTTTVRFLPSLHAKVYISDNTRAVVTSSNLTQNGIVYNYEYGICFDREPIIKAIRADVLEFAALGSRITPGDLASLALAADELREIRRSVERSAKRRLAAEFERRLSVIEDQIIRVRAEGQSLNMILERTIPYILRDGPKSTSQIHAAIQRIHPDLCDDSIDRVIDGRHYGRKWKHAVRSAQTHLKDRGVVTLRDSVWCLTILASALARGLGFLIRRSRAHHTCAVEVVSQ